MSMPALDPKAPPTSPRKIVPLQPIEINIFATLAAVEPRYREPSASIGQSLDNPIDYRRSKSHNQCRDSMNDGDNESREISIVICRHRIMAGAAGRCLRSRHSIGFAARISSEEVGRSWSWRASWASGSPTAWLKDSRVQTSKNDEIAPEHETPTNRCAQ